MALESTLELENNDGRVKSDANLLVAEGNTAGDEDGTKGKVTESVEMTFKDTMIPSWKGQLTLRAFVVSAILGVMFSFIVMKLNLTTGIIPSLNVAAGLLGFFLCEDLDKGVGAVWDLEASVYKAREHCYPNVCCCHFRHRI
ncbi:putative oligopeptide transporter, OPT superfamily [Helianthus annuus]|nr:putative oligopeptide transporter, OPT superfamily [Helianthus annuus]